MVLLQQLLLESSLQAAKALLLILFVCGLPCGPLELSSIEVDPYLIVKSAVAGHKQTKPPAVAPRVPSDRIIEPGTRGGPVVLGDTRERALQIFPPKPNIDSEHSYPNCGSVYEWVDTKSNQGGNLYIHFENGIVSQIDAAAEGYRTSEGLRRFSLPKEVLRTYAQPESYLISGSASEANGRHDLVIWIDRKSGIAFTFAYDKKRQARTIDKISVFKPNSEFCPEGCPLDSPDIHHLSPSPLPD